MLSYILYKHYLALVLQIIDNAKSLTSFHINDLAFLLRCSEGRFFFFFNMMVLLEHVLILAILGQSSKTCGGSLMYSFKSSSISENFSWIHFSVSFSLWGFLLCVCYIFFTHSPNLFISFNSYWSLSSHLLDLKNFLLSIYFLLSLVCYVH